ncbi:aminotransferase-like domain-containing protein [Nonomuraea rhodomycinica]|uniref:PLP-dependent aminotransferase family protein n=1 Tax=Nonomuraea rhodomycinica TaxID=1712872 RepID=A0A7Y6MA03_9ACTN|nr:PLP-dependent aminotransferase family protein [Nonomuraea rhodomycinica]NUW40112.1 PLP-dependent aminotransferase family protein [Nonomuraea rhodomycinica]
MNGANVGIDDLVDLLGRWASGRGPLYLLLAARFRALVDDGVLPPGTPLPPDRTLARRLAVGRGTVVAAYDLLQQEGRVTRRQGSGTRVAPLELPASRSADSVRANPLLLHILHPPDGVSLLTCASPDRPPAVLAEAYEEAVGRLAGLRDLGYQPAGNPELREAVAAYYRGRGLPTTAEEILVTTGAQQALTLLAGLLLAPGDTVLTQSPTYPGALEVFRHAAAVVRPVALAPSPAFSGSEPAHSLSAAFSDPGPALSPSAAFSGPGPEPVPDLAAAIRERPSLVYTVPTASNPTGATLSAGERRRLARLAEEHDVPIIDDEVCAELCFSGETPPPVASYARGEQVITIASLSKVVWGGLRVGWVRAPAPLVSRLARLRAVHDLGGEVLGQVAAAALLRRLPEIRPARVRELRDGHDHLCAELAARLPSWSFERATGGQTIWVRIPRGDVDAFAQVALRHGVAVPPGRSFDPLGGHAEYMRLHFLFPREEQSRAVAGLAAAWDAYDGTRGPAARRPLVV